MQAVRVEVGGGGENGETGKRGGISAVSLASPSPLLLDLILDFPSLQDILETSYTDSLPSLALSTVRGRGIQVRSRGPG